MHPIPLEMHYLYQSVQPEVPSALVQTYAQYLEVVVVFHSMLVGGLLFLSRRELTHFF